MLYRQKKDTCIRNCDGVGYITRSRAFPACKSIFALLLNFPQIFCIL